MTNRTRELTFVEHPGDLESEAAQDALAEAVADHVVAMVNAERKRQGLPPLDA